MDITKRARSLAEHAQHLAEQADERHGAAWDMQSERDTWLGSALVSIAYSAASLAWMMTEDED